MAAISEAIPIYEGQDFYVPYFEVQLKGRKAGPDVVRDIVSVSYKDKIGEIDSFEITINNWDAEQRKFKYSDETLFDPGTKLELWMGYYGAEHQRRMLTGEITSLRPTFPAGGQPKLAVSGLNILHRFRSEQISFAYENMKDSQIAKQIGGRLGKTVETDTNAAASEDQYEYLLQENQYDIIFLLNRAQRIGYDLFVTEDDDSKLKFVPTGNLRRPTYKLTYGRSLIQFQPNLTTANQVNSVTVRGWDAVNKKKIEHTATRQDLGTPEPAEGLDNAFKQKKEIIADRPISTEAEAKTLAEETLRRIAKDMIKASGSTVGLPDLRAGGVVEIDGVGDRFQGRYFVTGTTHAIGDGGYTTQFECRKEEK